MRTTGHWPAFFWQTSNRVELIKDMASAYWHHTIQPQDDCLQHGRAGPKVAVVAMNTNIRRAELTFKHAPW